MIPNNETAPQAFHATGDVPCPHQDFSSQLATGEFYDCVTSAPINPGAGPPSTYDHLYGPAASFWLKVDAAP